MLFVIFVDIPGLLVAGGEELLDLEIKLRYAVEAVDRVGEGRFPIPKFPPLDVPARQNQRLLGAFAVLGVGLAPAGVLLLLNIGFG